MARLSRTSIVGIDGNQIVRYGSGRGYLNDLYHFLLTRRWSVLLTLIFVLYLATNVLFALLYLAGGDAVENARAGSFVDAFFFSVQTMATIGYGKMAPRTMYAHALMVVESFSGILWVAMTTGLVFSKFSTPTSRVLFSNVAIIAPREGVPSLMFRMANERGNQIVEAQLRLSILRAEVTAEGETLRRFHDLKLQRALSPLFALTWTGVHQLTPDSPLYGVTAESLRQTSTLIVVSLVGIDSTSSQMMHARKTYSPDDIRWDVRFVDILSRLPDGRTSIDYRRFHDVQAVSGPPA
jgi:inward rectifier potassium channel